MAVDGYLVHALSEIEPFNIRVRHDEVWSHTLTGPYVKGHHFKSLDAALREGRVLAAIYRAGQDAAREEIRAALGLAGVVTR